MEIKFQKGKVFLETTDGRSATKPVWTLFLLVPFGSSVCLPLPFLSRAEPSDLRRRNCFAYLCDFELVDIVGYSQGVVGNENPGPL